MLKDYLPFERITYSKQTLASISEAIWIWFLYVNDIGPGGSSGSKELYTISSGYKAIISDVASNGTFRGISKYWIPGGDNICLIFFEPYEFRSHSFSLPPVANAGETVKYQIWNEDIITGKFRGVLTMWLVPGSNPEKVKKDEPEERFRLGDFSSAQQIVLPDGETLYLFHKRNENKENYLRFKDYGKPNQKKLASFHLNLDEAAKILDISNTKPEKVKEILANYEKKYKPKKFWG